MKKLFLYITLLLSFTSCEKYLEVKPSNILALKTYDDVKSLLGSHLKLPGSIYKVFYWVFCSRSFFMVTVLPSCPNCDL